MIIKTRTVQRPDGKREVIRLLDPEGLGEWNRDDPLAYEKSIVWTGDTSELPFVRVTTIKVARSRRGPLQAAGGVRVVGYAKLTPDAPRNPDGQTYTRRLFYLKDADLQRGADVPEGAIDPDSIQPGEAGRAVK